jgi:pimeloyl-ACP methyl ester carboxylesterase
MRTNRLMVPTNIGSGKINGTHHIAYTEWGDPRNSHVVICVHGLTRNCRDFDFLARALETRCRVFCVDVVGRGQSGWLDNAKDYDHYQLYIADAISLLRYICDQYNGNVKVDWVGISMGGLIGMMAAIQSTVPIHRLVMSDIGPLIPVAALKRMSAYVGKDMHFGSFEELEAYVKQISAPFGPLTDDQWRHLAVHSMRKFNDGTYGFRYDPKISVSFKEHALQDDVDLWEYWDKLQVSTLVVRGAESDVLLEKTATEMQLRGPKAKIVELPGIGHAPILLDNKQIAIVKNFLLPQQHA